MVAAKRTRWGAKEGYALLDQGLDLLENQAKNIAGFVDFPPSDIMQVCGARSALFSPPLPGAWRCHSGCWDAELHPGWVLSAASRFPKLCFAA